MSMNLKKKLIKAFDFLIILLFAGIFFYSLSMLSMGREKPVLKITALDSVYEYDISNDRRLDIQGRTGSTVIVIENGKVFVESSTCKNKNCVLMGKISRSGEWLCCAPNEVFAVITGKSNDDTDAVSY
ncbi:MAG: NusG domain II-containing protein [Treponema sp.]|nr:NusG domain II-containing protein [Candidatus Treponema scatequi]